MARRPASAVAARRGALLGALTLVLAILVADPMGHPGNRVSGRLARSAAVAGRSVR